MQEKKSEYVFLKLNITSNLDDLPRFDNKEKAIVWISETPKDLDFVKIKENGFLAVLVDWMDIAPVKMDFSFIDVMPIDIPVFVFVSQKVEKSLEINTGIRQNVTVLLCKEEIDTSVIQNCVATLLDNRALHFVRSNEKAQSGFDELIIGLDEYGRVHFCSADTCNFLGLLAKQILNKEISNWIFSQPKADETQKKIGKLIQGGKKKKYKEQILPIIGKKKNTLFYVVYENISINNNDSSYVLFHAQNYHEATTKKYYANKDHFYGLLEFIEDAILIIDLYGYVLDSNSAFTQLFGYALDDIQTVSTAMLFPSHELFEQNRQRLLANQKIQLVTFQKADGSLFEGEVSYSLFYDRKGDKQGYFLLFRNISERNELIDEKQKIQDRLRRTQEIARLAYWRYDFTELMVEFSDELYNMLNVPKISKLVKADDLFTDWIFPEDYKTILVFFREVKEGRLPSGIEFRIQKNGNIDYVYLEASDLITNDEGKVIQVDGIFQDITSRKRAEINSLQREMQIKSIINDLDGGYALYEVVANDEGIKDDAVLLDTNENFEKLLGIKPEEVIGKSFKTFLPQIAPRVLETGIRVAQTGETVDIPNDIFDENRWFDLHIYQPMEGQFAISFYDVAERERESINIHKKNKYLFALQETTHDLLTLRDIQTLLDNIIDRAIELVGVKDGFLDFMEPGGTNRYPRVTRGELVNALSFPVQKGVGLTGKIWESGQPMLIENYDEWEHRIPGFRREYISSVIGVPIFSNGNTVGVFVVAMPFGATERLTESDLEILDQFARLATLAIENTQLLEKLTAEISDRKIAEEQLQKSEENYRTLFENIPDGLYRTSLSGKFLAVNQAFIKMFGFSSIQELAQHNAFDFYVDLEDRESFIESFTQMNDTHSAEVLLKRKDGSQFYALENGRAVRDEDGNAQYLEGSIIDITERKNIQQLLEKQSNELSRLYSASEALFYNQSHNLDHLAKTIIDTVSQVFTQVNSSLFIYEPSEDALRILAFTQLEDDYKKVSYLPVQGKGIIAKSVRERTIMNVPDVSKDNDYLENWRTTCSELCIPLTINEQILGVLNIESNQCDAFNDDDVRLLSIFAEKASFSIQQAIITFKEQQRFEKLMQIQKLGTELSLLHDEKSILDTMLRYLRSISPGSNCIILIFDYLRSGYRIAAHSGFSDSYRPDRNEIIFNKDLIYHLQQYNIFYSGDMEKVMPSIREVFPESSYEQFVSFTLTNEGEVFGVILLTGEFASSKEDDAIIEVLAKIVSSALTNARLFEATNLTLERLASLRRIDLAIASSTDITFMVDVLLEQLSNQLNIDAADILLYSPAGHVFNYCSGRGINNQKFIQGNIRLGEGLTGKAAFNRETIIFKDLSKESDLDMRLQEMADDGFVSYIGIPVIAKGVIKGFLEVFQNEILNPAKDWMDYLEIISGQAAIAIETIDLFSNLQRSNTDLSLAYDSTLEGWASALELRDKETEGHTRRVAEMTIDLAISMNVKLDELKTIRWGALLHDIGKMGIPDDILLKPGVLTEEEWMIMRKHPVYAFELLSKIDYLRHALDIPYCHHEKWDGSGYPRRLKGEEIPLSARIFAVIDVWDALTSDRPYRKAWSEEKAMAYIVEQSGTHFDPRVVEHFQRIMKNRA